MKICRICRELAFDDAEICYACMHPFEAMKSNAAHTTEEDGLFSFETVFDPEPASFPIVVSQALQPREYLFTDADENISAQANTDASAGVNADVGAGADTGINTDANLDVGADASTIASKEAEGIAVIQTDANLNHRMKASETFSAVCEAQKHADKLCIRIEIPAVLSTDLLRWEQGASRDKKLLRASHVHSSDVNATPLFDADFL